MPCKSLLYPDRLSSTTDVRLDMNSISIESKKIVLAPDQQCRIEEMNFFKLNEIATLDANGALTRTIKSESSGPPEEKAEIRQNCQYVPLFQSVWRARWNRSECGIP